ncbi:hypothetical protein H6F44_07380 [Pseudanabaena sp. FACHB-1277]|uniref:FHA domain containing protein n=1 Tax=Pseudanabaena cinerea FACHB-1277 TaxID=2949581 RepID=A0A926URW6_9CYAN|nr:hypothetical protein [Pseudanabaena cinerea]MBD2149942.1 hypothetical protein [Pseudanabaena cinerea FACHB-1277]
MSAIANSNHPEDKNKIPRTQTVWRNLSWQKLTSVMVAIALCFTLTACGGSNKSTAKNEVVSKQPEIVKFTEVSPPSEIQRLSRLLDRYTPQISILSPAPNQVLTETEVAVKFDVKDLPIFKNAEFGLGPHIHVTLDNQEYKAVYDLSQAATFTNLSPGTHTIRAFASRPWHESFKNQGAYAQVSFNVLTKTDENNPDPKTPLLTYSRPVGTYGAEPIMLDFYIQNAPLHLLAQEDPEIDDWQIRATIDGQSFTLDRWEPIYLKGFKNGKNWVKLELIEEDGDAIANVFNSTAHLINYQPNGTDTLSRLVSGEKIANIDAIVDPNYVPPAPVETPAPAIDIPESAPAVTATPEAVKASAPEVIKESAPEVAKEAKPEIIKDTPKPEAAIAKPQTTTAPSAIPAVPTKPLDQPKVISPPPIKIAPVSPAAIKTAPEPVVKPATAPANPPITTKAVEKSPEKALEKMPTPSQNIALPQSKPKAQTETQIKGDGNGEVKVDAKTSPTETIAPLTDLSASTTTPVKIIAK